MTLTERAKLIRGELAGQQGIRESVWQLGISPKN
jgi:hypothetical protein